jgi:hypothetical protein
MKNLLYCRRSAVALIALGVLSAMAFLKDMDTSVAIASIAMGLAAANAGEAVGKGRYRREDDV